MLSKARRKTHLRLCLVFLVIFDASSASSSGDSCLSERFFGSWNTTGPRPHWQQFDRACPVLDGLDITVQQNYSILFFGDSLEHRQIQDLCKAGRHRNLDAAWDIKQLPESRSPKEEHWEGYDALMTCRFRAGYLQMTGFLTGVWPNGPYWLSQAHSNTRPQSRIRNAKALFEREWGGQPDVIVFNVNLWDNFRFQHDEFGISNNETLLEWKRNFSHLLSLTDELFPKTRLKFYHTTVLRTPNNRLRSPVISGLNAAGAAIARDHAWATVDLAALVDNFEYNSSYLRDYHHPRPFVLLTLFDLYISSAFRLLRKP